MTRRTLKGKLSNLASACVCGILATSATGAHGGTLTLADTPLFLGGVEPNVFFTLDDSGSMDFEILTKPYYYYFMYWTDTAGYVWVDNGRWRSYASEGNCTGREDLIYIFGNSDNVYYSDCNQPDMQRSSRYFERDWRGVSPSFNLMYYDPTSTYEPWIGHTDASFTAARSDPQPDSDGYNTIQNLGTVDLPYYGTQAFVYELTVDDKGFSGSSPDGPASATAGANGLVDLWDSHVRFLVGETGVTVETYVYDPTSTANTKTACDDTDMDGSGATPHFAACLGTTRTRTTLSGDGCYDILGENAASLLPGVLDGTTAADATGGSGCRTVAEAQQNIANWYEFGRRRAFVAKGAVGQLLDSIPAYRYGLTVINEYSSLFIEMPTYGSDYPAHNSALLESLYDFDWPSRGTPLRNGLSVAGQYYHDQRTQPSPIVESCQKNFTLLFTDGYYNKSLSWSRGDADGDSISDTLSDIAYYYYHTDLAPGMDNDVEEDAIDPATHQHMVTMTVAFGVSGFLRDELDNTTVVPGDPPTIANATGSGGPDGLPDTQRDGTLWAGTDNRPLFAGPQEDLGWSDATVTNNAENPQKIDDLWHAAYNSKGVYINAQTPEELVGAMKRALAAIEERTSSASSVALNSGSLNENTRTYQARFDSRDWSGELLSIPISDGSANATCTVDHAEGELCPTEWNAGEELADQHWDTGRTILTWFPGDGTNAAGGASFRWGSLSAAQQEALKTDPDTGTVGSDAAGQARLDYLRGDPSNEGFGFRERDGDKLGDIVHSSPIFVGGATFRWPDSLKTGTIASPGSLYAETYSAFRTRVANRTPLIYVGANDGMLHAFNAYFDAQNNATTDSGKEVLAYVPHAVYSRLGKLTSPDYEHEFYVNGDITRGDVYFGSDNQWHTVIVGTLRGGGQGVYALDVTSPGTGSSPTGFTEGQPGSVVLWEFTDADNPNTVEPVSGDPLVDGDPDLGYTFSRPSIARMANGKWAAIFGNGYNNTEADGSASTSGNAVLYIVDIETGELMKKIDTGKGTAHDPTGGSRPNGLATPTPIDQNRDSFAETIYAGDLFGNVWKFDVSDADAANWGIDSPAPLFVTADGDLTSTDTSSTAQPITTRIVTGPHPKDPGGVMLYFGTGKYMEVTDNSSSNQQTQTFYGLWDDGTRTLPIDRSSLLEQKIIEEMELVVDDTDGSLRAPTEGEIPDQVIRVTTDETDPLDKEEGETVSPYAIDWSTHDGWLMELVNHGEDAYDNRGERVDADPLLRNGRIIFITTLPNESACSFGGDSFLMELDANDGSRLAFTPFDLNNDREFSEEDYVTITVNNQEITIPASGRMSREGIIQQPGVLVSGDAEYKYASGSAGGIDITVENPGPLTMGRQSWRQLR